LQDRPNARELIEAVASFLDNELVPTITDSRLRFRTLIAINVLGIVSRELELGNAVLIAEWQRLASLLAESEPTSPVNDANLVAEINALRRELRDRIRSGDFDEGDRFDAALNYAESAVAAKLRISNPRFLTRLGIEPKASECTT
jgi:hypothetical protein